MLAEKEDRIIFINDIDECSMTEAVNYLFSFAFTNKEPIYIVINSNGGDIYEMLALYDVIKYIQSLGIEVNTIGIGKIMSSGVIILASGNSRKIGKNSTIMCHWGTAGLEGNIFQVENELLEFKRIEKTCNKILAHETNLSEEQIEKFILNPANDIYILPEDAIKYGIADGLLTYVPYVNNKKNKNNV